MYDVITVGSATLDVFAKTKSELIKIETPTAEEELIAYPSGSKIIMTHLEFMTGGGGTNTAVSFSKMGLKTAYLGKVGEDENGNRILQQLKKEKVDFVGVREKGMSGYSIILDSIKEDRTILVHKGVNDDLKFPEIGLNRLKTKWFYFSSMMGESYKTLEKLSDYAKKNSIKVAFNPSSYLTKKGLTFLKKVLMNTNALILNKEEAEMLVGKGEMKSLLKAIHKSGPEIAIITDGKKGAFASDGKKLYFVKPHKVKVVETTGAGDAFASGFVSGLIKKNDIKFALKLGLTNAESVVCCYGAKNGLLKYKDALDKMKKMGIHIKEKKF